MKCDSCDKGVKPGEQWKVSIGGKKDLFFCNACVRLWLSPERIDKHKVEVIVSSKISGKPL